ncbi:hypothetical protein TGME49_286170 [Toxoplasma gondii ME49]|uniref:Uncharacterized protein n=1 Tax=Toxoplasma gondii (strain ATCC 50611 / Me49) TaxID=508771 RepID=S8GGR6_TOXGM|nr:hypothetical protein TGME49_286170 [Toxoplasma gondii ME49]EPT31040.1 hypothetical protein TGME49_286170 [Toxoplasma gondii ME49]|eukprot:XP_002369254.1 hypothetical protein TGME49_286170 [Toxoplasma gondii ME49]
METVLTKKHTRRGEAEETGEGELQEKTGHLRETRRGHPQERRAKREETESQGSRPKEERQQAERLCLGIEPQRQALPTGLASVKLTFTSKNWPLSIRRRRRSSPVKWKHLCRLLRLSSDPFKDASRKSLFTLSCRCETQTQSLSLAALCSASARVSTHRLAFGRGSRESRRFAASSGTDRNTETRCGDGVFPQHALETRKASRGGLRAAAGTAAKLRRGSGACTPAPQNRRQFRSANFFPTAEKAFLIQRLFLAGCVWREDPRGRNGKNALAARV